MRARLAWSDADGRHTLRTQLDLPLLAEAAYGALAEDPEVRALMTVLEAARLKRESMAALDRGDRDTVMHICNAASCTVAAAPLGAATPLDLTDLDAQPDLRPQPQQIPPVALQRAAT